MPVSADKTTITAVIPTELKERLKVVAKLRRWTLSQAIGALIEENFDSWCKELGIDPKPVKTAKSRKSKTENPD